jgi:hypothetical protein
MDEISAETTRGEARSVKPRQRFLEKAESAGYSSILDQGLSRRLQADRWDRLSATAAYAMETMALVWPDKAFAFQQVIVLGRLVEDIAADKGVNEKTVRRWLAGHIEDMGAEDWFLITLELYRESDEIIPNGADLIHDCFMAAKLGEYLYGPLERPLFVLLLEALAGGTLDSIIDSLPWQEDAVAHKPVLAWPCSHVPGALSISRMPGLLETLYRTPRSDLVPLLLTAVLLYDEHPEMWRGLLDALNELRQPAGSSSSETANEKLQMAATTVGLMLRQSNHPLNYAILAIMAWTPLEWTVLCRGLDSDQQLHRLQLGDRVRYCTQQILQT